MAASNQRDASPGDSLFYAATSFWTDADMRSTYGVGRAYKFIVLHHTAGSKNGDLAQLTGPVSVHKYVTKSGERYHLLDDLHGAYGCGTDVQNKTNILGDPWTRNENIATLQVELENLGSEPFTDPQYQITAEWTANWCKKYGIPVDRQHILAHKEISKVKNDPNPTWDWNRFLSLVNAKMGGSSSTTSSTSSSASPTTEDMSGINFQAGDFGPGSTLGANVWVRARPSTNSSHVMTIAAQGTQIKFDGTAEDLDGKVIQGGTRWYHIKPGQTDGSGQQVRGWVHSKMIG